EESDSKESEPSMEESDSKENEPSKKDVSTNNGSSSLQKSSSAEGGAIKLQRENRLIIDKGREYDIMLDDENIGKIRNGETVEFDADPGKHELYLKIDQYRSNKIEFNKEENEEIKLKCTARAKGLKILLIYFYIFLWQNKYLSVRKI
ncbi:MAG: hypothetical protein ACQEQC_08520, partial [Elusimicrobiota bacterium]